MPRSFARPAAVVLALAGALALAGCADNQPGDVNNGPGYTDNAADLQVKMQAYAADPCRSAQATSLFQNCGRFVTEVAGSVSTIQQDVAASYDGTVTALQQTVNQYQQLGCDEVNGTATKQQLTDCPAALRQIGADLDKLVPAVEASAASSADNAG